MTRLNAHRLSAFGGLVFLPLHQQVDQLQGPEVHGGSWCAATGNLTRFTDGRALAEAGMVGMLQIDQFHDLQHGYAQALKD